VLEVTGSSSELSFSPYTKLYGQGIEDMLHRIPATDKVHGAIGWDAELDLDRILADVVAERRAPTAA
jgi:UDP-glucose 4-epimerase